MVVVLDQVIVAPWDYKTEKFVITDPSELEYELINTPLENSVSVLVNWLEQDPWEHFTNVVDTKIVTMDVSIWYVIWDILHIRYVY